MKPAVAQNFQLSEMLFPTEMVISIDQYYTCKDLVKTNTNQRHTQAVLHCHAGTWLSSSTLRKQCNLASNMHKRQIFSKVETYHISILLALALSS